MVALIDEPRAVGEVFNIGNGAEISINDLAERIRVLTGGRSDIVRIPYDEAYEAGFEDMPRRVPDISKIHALVGYTPTVDLDELYDLAAAGPGLEDTALQRAEIREIWRAVEALPTPQRTALALKFQEDMKIADIAAVMGKSEGAVKLLIHRGVTRLRAVMHQEAER